VHLAMDQQSHRSPGFPDGLTQRLGYVQGLLTWAVSRCPFDTGDTGITTLVSGSYGLGGHLGDGLGWVHYS
jgi:hypothetical protein